jgi:hypothetical protein
LGYGSGTIIDLLSRGYAINVLSIGSVSKGRDGHIDIGELINGGGDR